jgi:transcriptional regulator with XRE-family HTH domain
MPLSEFKTIYPELFYKARKSKKLSQQKVGQKLGLTLGNICHYEKAIREPNLAMFDLWSKAVGLDIEITINDGKHTVC